MLLKAALVKNGIEKLSEEISYFIHQAQHVCRWSPKLFTDEFYTAVILKSDALERELRAFFREFRRLPENHRTLIIEEFNRHNAVRELCAGRLSRTQHWQEIDNPAFAAATKSLFVWMYKKTLESVAYREFSGECLRDHYQSYRDAYGHALCPFCGLEDYAETHREGFPRDAYDHYLPKQNYPFAAVNPDNLFPMCHHCNTDFKAAQDVLINSIHQVCCRAAYPPDDSFNIAVVVEDALSLEPRVSVSLAEAEDDAVLEKFQTWLRIFEIPQRYEARIQKRKQDWLADVIARLGTGGAAKGIGAECEAHRDELQISLDIRPQKEHHVRIPFLTYCADRAEALTAFLQNQPRFATYLSARATALVTE